MIKLPFDYKNPVNRVLAQDVHRDYKPKVGDYMTLLGSSNRTVWTVIHVNEAQTIVLVQEANVQPVAGAVHGHQDWEITPDQRADVKRVSLQKDGTWRQWRERRNIYIPGSRYYYAWSH